MDKQKIKTITNQELAIAIVGSLLIGVGMGRYFFPFI